MIQSLPGARLVFGGSMAISGIPWLKDASSDLCFHVHMAFLYMCVSVSKFPLFIRTSVMRIRAPPQLWYDLLLPNYIYNKAISK